MTNFSYWLGVDDWSVPTWHLLPEGDIAVGRVEGFDAEQVSGFPVFQTGEMDQGASLCRLGFPFHSLAASYDEAANRLPWNPALSRFPGSRARAS
jgi:hypothetical protein